MTELTIGALAQRMQCQTETIRFYEQEGLLPAPARPAATTACTARRTWNAWPSSAAAARST